MKPLGSSPRNSWRVSPERVDTVRTPHASCVVEMAAQPRDVRFDLARAAIIVVDMQNDFCHPDGWLASIGVDVAPARRPIEPINACLPVLREKQVPVIWLNWGNRPDRLNISPALLGVYDPNGDDEGIGAPLRSNGAPILQAGSWAAAIVDELDVAEHDIMVDKYRMSGFFDTHLDSILRNLKIDTLLFAGVNMDQCVMWTLQDASCLGYDCILLSDCSATTSPRYCEDATLYNVRQCLGMTATGADLVQAAKAAG